MSLYSYYKSCSDEKWLKVLSGHRGLFNRLTDACRATMGWAPVTSLPRLPDSRLQASFVGSSGANALKEGFVFYQRIKETCRSLGKPIKPDNKVLDFGCGWGRITRFFLKDVYAENLVGVDVDEEVIRICRETIPEGTFKTVEPTPPTPLSESTFDVIFAYSVFSHLAEEAHLAWIKHFAKLLVPGGLLFATTQKRNFIEYCNSLTEDQITTPWHQSLARAFRPLEDSLNLYDNGELVYCPTGGGGVRDASFYGEAAFSANYAKKRWSPDFDVLSFDDTSLPQALVIAQRQLKPGESGT